MKDGTTFIFVLEVSKPTKSKFRIPNIDWATCRALN